MSSPNTEPWIVHDAVVDKLGDNVVTEFHLVIGRSIGMYAETSWGVRGFLDKEEAEAFCSDLNDWCKENKCYAPSSVHSVSGALSVTTIQSGSGSIASGQIGSYHFAGGAIPPDVVSGYGSFSSGFGMVPPDVLSGPATITCPLDPNFKNLRYGTNYTVTQILLNL